MAIGCSSGPSSCSPGPASQNTCADGSGEVVVCDPLTEYCCKIDNANDPTSYECVENGGTVVDDKGKIICEDIQ